MTNLEVPRISIDKNFSPYVNGWMVDVVYGGGPYKKGRAYCETLRTRPKVIEFAKQFNLSIFYQGKCIWRPE